MTLRGLIEAVSDGTDMNATVTAARAVFPDLTIRRDLLKACDGSLDAAKALHDALLPGWGAATGFDYYTDFCRSRARVSDTGKNFAATIDDTKQIPRPARAWLLAILRALEGEP